MHKSALLYMYVHVWACSNMCVCVPVTVTVRACTKCSHRQDAARCQVFVRELNAKTRKLNIARSAGAQQGVPKAWQMEESGGESGRAT